MAQNALRLMWISPVGAMRATIVRYRAVEPACCVLPCAIERPENLRSDSLIEISTQTQVPSLPLRDYSVPYELEIQAA